MKGAVIYLIYLIYLILFAGVVAGVIQLKIMSQPAEEPSCQQVGWYEACVAAGGVFCPDIYPKCEE